MKKIISICLALIFSAAVWAADLGDLKSQGIVGELPNGYLGLVVTDANSETRQLITNINSKRKAIYQKQAVKNKIPLSEVEKIAAKRNFAKTRAGNFVKLNGQWTKK